MVTMALRGISSGIVVWCVMLSLLNGSKADILQTLSDLVESRQMTESSPYGGIEKPMKMEGTYYQDMRFNFHGSCDNTTTVMPVVDSFSAYALCQLIDAFRFGKAPPPSPISVQRSVQALDHYHDKDVAYNSSIITFLPETYDEESGLWAQTPGSFPDLGPLVEAFMYSHVEIMSVLFGNNPAPSHQENLSATKFTLGADFDCTALNLVVGSLLYDQRDVYPQAWQHWNGANSNVSTSVFYETKRCAYRPFSQDRDVNTIDPRTYYVFRDFLDKAKAEGRDVALITTYVDTLADVTNEHIEIPHGTNNVDVTVIANYITAMVSSLTSGLFSPQVFLDDPELMNILESSGDLVVHSVKYDFAGRPDLALVYYPSIYEVYWFISRGLLYLENAHQNGPLPVPVFEKYYQNLAQVMRNELTTRLLEQRTVGQNGDFYFDDFLGDADCDGPVKRYEDRLFTTSMAANALLYTWTVDDEEETSGLRWLDSTPQAVKDTVYGCAKFLEENVLTGQYDASNTFFSFDTNGQKNTLPYWYPTNRFEFLNGTKISGFDRFPFEPTIFGVEGYIEPEKYEEMLKVEQFGIPTPTELTSAHGAMVSPIYFSTDALTYAGTLLTIAMKNHVDDRA